MRTTKLHITQPAFDDIQNAMEWYVAQSDGLELRFYKHLIDRLKFIRANPEAAAFLDKRFRGSQLKKFPFTVYYHYNEVHDQVKIAAVLHNKRNRSILKKRDI